MAAVQAGELVLDYGIYPRYGVNGQHVSTLTAALRSGSVFPPVVVDRETRQVIDGFHRATATIRARGVEGAIEVEERDFSDDFDRLAESVRLNTLHGLNLSAAEMNDFALKASTLERDPSWTAALMHVPVEQLERLMVRKSAFSEGGERITVKRVAEHLRGRVLTEKQREANRRSIGQNHVFLSRQLLLIYDGDLIDWDNPIERDVLRQVHARSGELLAEVAAPEPPV